MANKPSGLLAPVMQQMVWLRRLKRRLIPDSSIILRSVE